MRMIRLVLAYDVRVCVCVCVACVFAGVCAFHSLVMRRKYVLRCAMRWFTEHLIEARGRLGTSTGKAVRIRIVGWAGGAAAWRRTFL